MFESRGMTLHYKLLPWGLLQCIRTNLPRNREAWNDVALCVVFLRWARLARLSDACISFASELLLLIYRMRVVFVSAFVDRPRSQHRNAVEAKDADMLFLWKMVCRGSFDSRQCSTHPLATTAVDTNAIE